MVHSRSRSTFININPSQQSSKEIEETQVQITGRVFLAVNDYRSWGMLLCKWSLTQLIIKCLVWRSLLLYTIKKMVSFCLNVIGNGDGSLFPLWDFHYRWNTNTRRILCWAIVILLTTEVISSLWYFLKVFTGLWQGDAVISILFSNKEGRIQILCFTKWR